MDALERGRQFVLHDVWRLGAPGEEVPHGFIIKQVRVAFLLVQNLVRDALTLRAAALTFATALGIVPFLALVFLVIQTFQVDEKIYAYLNEQIEARIDTPDGLPLPATESADGEPTAPAPEDSPALRQLKQGLIALLSQGVGQFEAEVDGVPLENPVKAIVDYAQRGAAPQTIGFAGLIFVIATVFGLMKNIESSFNTIWGLKLRRSWYRLFSDYLILMLLLPFVVALVLFVTAVLESNHLREQLGPLALGLRSVQYIVIWMVFTTMYALIPNTRVRLRYAIAGGVVAGTMWCLLSWLYVKFQVGLPRFSLFYSTFAQVPLVLVWVYFSWLIVLFGAELTFAYQHEKTFAMERLAQGASYAYREAAGLWAMVEMGRRFDAGQAPLSVVEFAERWNVPTRLLADVLDVFDGAGLVTPCSREGDTFQPARSLDRIAVADVLGALREEGRDPSELRTTPAFLPLKARLFEPQAGVAGQTLAQLIQQLPAEETAGDADAPSLPERPLES